MNRDEIKSLVEDANKLIHDAREMAESKDADREKVDAMLAEAAEKKAKADDAIEELDRTKKLEGLTEWSEKSVGRLPSLGADQSAAPTTIEYKANGETKTWSYDTSEERKHHEAFRRYIMGDGAALAEGEALRAECDRESRYDDCTPFEGLHDSVEGIGEPELFARFVEIKRRRGATVPEWMARRADTANVEAHTSTERR